MNVLVAMGSATNEDRYGIESGRRVIDALLRKGHQVEAIHATQTKEILKLLLESNFDAVVPIGFGSPCEDGHIYSAARMVGIPCSGPTPAAGGVMQDKDLLAKVVAGIFSPETGIRPPIGCVVNRGDSFEKIHAMAQDLRVPLLVKPCFGGSSEGMLVTSCAIEATTSAIGQIELEGKVLIQQLEAQIVKEISCTTLDTPSGRIFLPVVELMRDDVQVMGIEEKFGSNARDRHRIPAEITSKMLCRVENAVNIILDTIGAVGLTRTDILILHDESIVILELNGIPGMLSQSIACDAALKGGISFEDLCEMVVQSAFLDRKEPNVWPMGKG